MKSLSTRSLYVALDALYALGLIVSWQLAANDSNSNPGAVLLLAPIVLTILLVLGQYVVDSRELSRSRAGHGSGVAPSHKWAWFLLIYMAVALLTAASMSFDSSYLP
jgi:hypothetical protein